MFRPRWQKLLKPVRRISSWWSRRQLKHRPGHFSVRPRRTPGRLRSALLLIPWRWLASPHPVAAAVLTTVALIGYVAMDVETVGANPTLIANHVESNRPAPPSMPEESSMHLQGNVAMLLQVAMLQDAVNRLEQISNYTATFEKQEMLDDELSGEQVIALKIRHEPFSVYFKYEQGDDPGREILYPISSEDRRMLVQLPKFGGRLPALKLEPHSTLAMSEARYPITMAGIKELAEMALEIRRGDLKKGDHIRAEMRDDRSFAGRPVYAFTIEYADKSVSETYRKCELYVDKAMMVPVRVRNWTWLDNVDGADPGSVDASTLIEVYAFRDIRIDAELTPADFASSNPNYKFR